MWSLIGILLAAACIGIVEVPSLLKRKMRKELLVFSVLLLMGTGVSIAQNARAPLPNPLEWIRFVFQPVSDAIFSFLEQ